MGHKTKRNIQVTGGIRECGLKPMCLADIRAGTKMRAKNNTAIKAEPFMFDHFVFDFSFFFFLLLFQRVCNFEYEKNFPIKGKFYKERLRLREEEYVLKQITGQECGR